MLVFDVNNQIITRKDEFRVVSDSKNYLTAKFEMSEEWKGSVVILFEYGGVCYEVLLGADKVCTVPFEVIKPPFFSVSAFCGEDMLVTANSVSVDVEKSGFAEGNVPQTPTPDIWQQYLSEMHKLIECGLPYIGENSNWFLFDAKNGEYKDSGICAEGYIPIRGVDYWTEKDKTELVEDVITALPDADTMSFPLEETVSEVSEE